VKCSSDADSLLAAAYVAARNTLAAASVWAAVEALASALVVIARDPRKGAARVLRAARRTLIHVVGVLQREKPQNGIRTDARSPARRKEHGYMTRVVCILALLVPAAFAQPTWNGLSFGMTETQSREALKGLTVADIRNVKQKQPNDNTFYFLYEVTGFEVLNLTGSASLRFSVATKTLVAVHLYFSLPEGMDAFDRRAKGDLIPEFLTKRYGKPTLFDCGTRTTWCEGTWRDGGQTIQLHESRAEHRVDSGLTTVAPTGISIVYQRSKDAGIGL
jgi:hypothetical protein